jgi:hypothetical protein
VSPLSKRASQQAGGGAGRALSPFSQKMAPTGAAGGMHLPHGYAPSAQIGKHLTPFINFNCDFHVDSCVSVDELRGIKTKRLL